MQYASIEPFGEERADLRSAIVASTVANAMSAKGRRYTPADFMPKFGRAQTQSASDIYTAFRALFPGAPSDDDRDTRR